MLGNIVRIKGNEFKPKVFGKAEYKIRVGYPKIDNWQEFSDVQSSIKPDKIIKQALNSQTHLLKQYRLSLGESLLRYCRQKRLVSYTDYFFVSE